MGARDRRVGFVCGIFVCGFSCRVARQVSGQRKSSFFAANSEPRALKRGSLFGLDGTTEVVPFPKTEKSCGTPGELACARQIPRPADENAGLRDDFFCGREALFRKPLHYARPMACFCDRLPAKLFSRRATDSRGSKLRRMVAIHALIFINGVVSVDCELRPFRADARVADECDLRVQGRAEL